MGKERTVSYTQDNTKLIKNNVGQNAEFLSVDACGVFIHYLSLMG